MTAPMTLPLNVPNFLSLLMTPTKFPVSFGVLVYRSKESGELSKYYVNLGVDTRKTYESDIETLKSVRPTLTGDSLTGCDELIKSMETSLDKGIGNNPFYTLKDVLVPTLVKGVFVHKTTGEIYLHVSVNRKRVIEKGTYKTVNSSNKTIEKNKLRKTLRSGKIRTFIIGNISDVRMKGGVLKVVGV